MNFTSAVLLLFCFFLRCFAILVFIDLSVDPFPSSKAMAAELVGGAFLSAFLDVLVDRLASGAEDFFRGKEAIVKLLKELNTTLNSAGLLLNDAEEKLIKDQRVKKWLDDLKDTVYDADDLVYKINTEALRKELEGESQSSVTSKLPEKLNLSSFTSFDKEIKPEIDEILGKMKFLLEQKNNLGLLNVKTKLPERLIIAPLVDESDVYGRDVDKEAIINKLLLVDGGSDDELSVIPIVGMGGIGKTTLAQLVYNDERVNKRFDTKAWVTVGDDKIDCKKVMKIIFKKVTNYEIRKTDELHDLQVELKEVLMGKKFLFVLDDIWDEDPQKWDVLKSSFKSGSHGSAIIVTTRSTNVASIMKTGSMHQLDRISDDDGWRLFAKHSSIDMDYSNLQVIGREIVDKCKGLPLAIKSIGALLRGNRNEKEWENILNNDVWGLYERRKIGILPALWLSYYYLPSDLKPCIAYCTMFPKDYKFVKEKIILIWMAEGFLLPKNEKRMEEVGEEYFQDLRSRSFFQPTHEDEQAFRMHNLLHDLAIFVSSEFCLGMDDTKFSNCVGKIRHLSYRREVDDPKIFEGLSKAKVLRTFLTLPDSQCGRWSLPVEHLLESLVCTRHCLRVLSLPKCYITKLPDSIGDLKYLKYLDLSDSSIQEIPEIICNLYNLQTLLLTNCSSPAKLPANIGNLINLRHLYTPSGLQEMPQQICKMKTLQSLDKFVMSKNSGSAGIEHLKELQDLHGSLWIIGLENVIDAKDALEAELKNKSFLSRLCLSWGSSHEPDVSQKEREVLDALQPHASLKELNLNRYKGTSFPNWVGDHLYSNLEEVILCACEDCCILPPLGQLPSLKRLRMSHMYGVQRIGSEFYSNVESPVGTKPFRSLERLEIVCMSNLEEWSFIEAEVEGGVFPRLKELRLWKCPRLKLSLPDCLPSLKKLYMFDCDQLLPLLPRAQQMDAAFPSLEMLGINSCVGQDLLLEGGLPSSLKHIIIKFCGNLKALDEEAFQRLTALEKLEISHCHKLQCLPRTLSTTLSHLSITKCDLLVPRLRRETGEDWPMIENIPSLDIVSDEDDEDLFN